MVHISNCPVCKHLIKDGYCKAFADGIPQDVWDGYNYVKNEPPSINTFIKCNGDYKYEPDKKFEFL